VFMKQTLGALGARRLKLLRELLDEARANFGTFPPLEQAS
jgi:hypothetical protein